MRPSKRDMFMGIANVVARRGTCPRRQVGAVLVRDDTVVATGYNGSQAGQPHCDEAGCILVEGHCVRTIHAEMNVIFQAARRGVPTDGTTLYSTLIPCFRCQAALTACGISWIYDDASYVDHDNVSVLLHDIRST